MAISEAPKTKQKKEQVTKPTPFQNQMTSSKSILRYIYCLHFYIPAHLYTN